MTATALKIALREARASRGKFVFVVLAVAAGVGALTGVRGFSQSFSTVLLKEARSLMAADISARLFAEPTEEQQAAIDSLVRQGAEYTRVTETLSMVSPVTGSDPVLTSVKAIDPDVFPFYGAIAMEPAGELKDRLKADTTVISDDLRLRLKLEAGDMVRIGGDEFKVAGILTIEPDRMSGSFNVGPRLLVSREGLERAGLMSLGSRASQRLLFRLKPGAPPISKIHGELRRAFPEALIVDFRELNPNIARGLDRATIFLSLVSLIALIVGAIGVGTSMHAHLQQKMDSIAIMKSIGGRSNQVIRIYIIQTLILGLAGGIAGIAVGLLVQAIFPFFLQRYFQIQPDVVLNFTPAAQGLLIGLLTTLLFTLPPLLSIRRIPPGLIFRREMPEAKLTWKARIERAKPAIFSGVLICAAIAGIAAWLATGTNISPAKLGGTFAGGLIASIAILWLVAAALTKGLRFVVAHSSRMPVMLRHAVANLYRPGSQATAVLIALGVGVMFTLSVYLIQRSVISEIARSAPPGMPNMFFLDITPGQHPELMELIRKHPGTEGAPELINTVPCKLVAVDNEPIAQITRLPRRYYMARAVTTVADKPAGLTIASGEWWKPDAREPQISITNSAARTLRVGPGSTLTWSAFGRTINTRVATVHGMDSERLRAMVEFIVSPGTLDGLPTTYYAAARVKSSTLSALQRATYDRFPTVTVINIAEVLDRVQEIVTQISVVIRFISAFAIFAGAIILSSSIAGTRYRRIREVVIFKTLGATRARIARMFSAEFLILGIVAGLLGSALATAFSSLVLSRFFEAHLRFDIIPNLVAIVATALVAAASGWLASFRILGQKPLEVLRGE